MGPAKNAPSVRAAISGMVPNGASAPEVPRFSPNTTSRTLRWDLADRADTASNNACPRGAAFVVDEERQPARQVRVLDGNGGGVTVVHVFQRVDGRPVDPAGAGGARDRDDLAAERAAAFHLGDGELRILPRVALASEADVGERTGSSPGHR